MHLTTYLEFLQRAEQTLGADYRLVSAGHLRDAAVHYATARFADQCSAHADALAPALDRAGTATEPVPERLHLDPMLATRNGPAGMLRDLQDLYQRANLVDITWSLVSQAAQGARDRDLLRTVRICAPQTSAQLEWLKMIMTAHAPQTLLVAG